METEILIVGAGLTGLTIAHYLNKAKRDFLAIERLPFVGGVIQTRQQEGFIFEQGPNTGVLSTEATVDLFDDLKEQCTLQIAGSNVNKRYVLKKGHWQPLPSGLLSGIQTPLFSGYDKLRILGEPFRRRGKNPHETLDQLVKRRLGNSFLEYAVDPFILGIYAGNPAYLVPKYALPKLYNLEQKYGSFIRGAIKLGRERKQTVQKATRQIFSSQGGLSNFIKALYHSSGTEHFYTGTSQWSIRYQKGLFFAKGFDQQGHELAITAQKVITTTSANELVELLPFLETDTISAISNLLYASVIQVALGFKQWQGIPLDGFGGLIPFCEKRDLLGILFPSAFFPERAPERGALLSIFLGGVRRPELYTLSDTEITAIIAREVSELMKLKTFQPDLFHLFRYRHAIPQYGIDTEKRYAAVDKAQKQFPGLFVAGNLRDGIGMADRIQQGREIAQLVLGSRE
jgi:oxygen-dependent protoporphyrinogen oxidase